MAAVLFMKNHSIDFYGANCGVGTEELLQTISEMKNAGGDKIIAKSNCGIPFFDNGIIKYSESVESMGNYAVKARNFGANFIGGCCGTEAKHIKQIKKKLDNSPYKFLKLEQNNLPARNTTRIRRNRRGKKLLNKF